MRMNDIRIKQNTTFNIIFAVIGVLCGGIARQFVTSGSALEIILFTAVTVVLFLNSVMYALSGNAIGIPTAGNRYSIKYKLLTMCIVALVYMPLCTESFFFHDDYLNFFGTVGESRFYISSVMQGRQITGIFTDLLSFVTPETACVLRVFAVVFLLTYLLTLGNAVYGATGSQGFAAFLSTALVLLIPVVNVTAYGSMFCYPLAFVFGGCGILYFRAASESAHKGICFFMGMLYIIAANFVYQAVATVAFLFVFLLLALDNRNKDPWFVAKMTAAFVLSTGVYFVMMKVLSASYSGALMGRGAMISTPEDVLHKLVWFTMVLKENIKQLAISFLGTDFISNKWMYYILDFWSRKLELLVLFCGGMGILGALVVVGRTKGIWCMLQTATLIPLSYYVFLLLLEDGYTSYYSVALCSLLLVMCMLPILAIARRLPAKLQISRLYGAVAVVMIAVLAWNAGSYVRDFWVGYNVERYESLKHGIETQYQDQSRIHIIGTLQPGQADVYVKVASVFACRDLGIETEGMTVTASSNADYVETLGLDIYEQMLTLLSAQEQAFLQSVYQVDYHFSLCTLKGGLTEADFEQLAQLFRKADVIPEESENVLVVDILNTAVLQ